MINRINNFDLIRIKELISNIVKSDSVNNNVKDKINEILNSNITDSNEYISKLKELTNEKKIFIKNYSYRQ